MKQRFQSCAGVGLILVLCFVACISRADGSLSVGAASEEITPKEPVPLWGYALRNGLSEGILDPLYADALVLRIGSQKLALVSLDLGRCPAERSLANIHHRMKVEAGIDNSFIMATHTHHGPVLEFSNQEGKGKGRFDAALRYYRQMEDAIVAAVVKANNHLQPAKMAYGAAKLQKFNFNRLTGLYPPPNDPELAVMRFDDVSGAPLASVVNFAAHPTLVPESVMKFSADYVGVLKKAVREKLGGTVLFAQGAAGDLAADEGDDYQQYGNSLAEQAIKLALSLKPEAVSPPIWTLQWNQKRFSFASRLDLEDRRTRRQCDRLFPPELVANYADQYAAGIEPRLTVAMLNQQVALVGVPGEFFSSFSARLRQQIRNRQIFFFGYCNGYWQYFPTKEAITAGGYGTEPLSAPAQVGAGEVIMAAAADFIHEMEHQGETPATALKNAAGSSKQSAPPQTPLPELNQKR